MVLPINFRRTSYRKGLNDLYVPYYDALCSILSYDWQPTSGLRSLDDQRKLYDQGRVTPGRIVTKARPGLSMHNYGLASDWDYFPNGIYTPLDDDSPQWKEYSEAVKKVGLECLSWEKPHNQLPIPCTVQKLFQILDRGGMDEVNKYLKEAINGKSIGNSRNTPPNS